MARALYKFRLALLTSFSHDVFGTAKAAAYSAILCLFPTILVLTTLLAVTPESDTVRGELRAAFAEVLPADTMTLLHDYFTNQKVRGEQVVSSAILVSLVAAMGMMLSLMGGFRRAYDLPRHEWGFWVERGVALALVPLCLVPMGLATVMVAFGHQIEQWVVSNSYHVLGPLVLFIWRMVRWTIGLFTTIVMLAVIYQFGTPRRRAWKYVLPGASGAALIWFLTTLGFGFYLTRFADYSVVYGPLGAVVATLVWLYIATVSVLIGAEFNAHIFPKPQRLEPRPEPVEEEKMVTAGKSDSG
jgi:membrane protein